MKMSLTHTNALLVAITDLEHARRRAQAALTQVVLLPEDARSPLELQARVQAISGDIKAILARLASAESRVRIGIQEGDSPTPEAPPEVLAPKPEAIKPEADRGATQPVSPVSPWDRPPTSAPAPASAPASAPAPTPAPAPAPAPAPVTQADQSLYEDFEGVRIRVGAAKPRAGYVHWRDRRHVLGAALEVGVPAEVIHHADLMTANQKPTALGWKRAEKLIVQVQEAVDKGVAPDALWQKWMPTDSKS